MHGVVVAEKGRGGIRFFIMPLEDVQPINGVTRLSGPGTMYLVEGCAKHDTGKRGKPWQSEDSREAEP